jgi:tetratricopeptide (TPR) repeat protein
MTHEVWIQKLTFKLSRLIRWALVALIFATLFWEADIRWSAAATSYAYRGLGEKEKTLTSLTESLNILSRAGDRLGEGELLLAYGDFYRAFGNEPKALEYFQQSLSIARTTGFIAGEASVLNKMGLLYGKLGNMEKAMEHTRQALFLYRALKSRGSEAGMLFNLALFHPEYKQRALEYYSQALPLWRVTGQSFNQIFTLRNNGDESEVSARWPFAKATSGWTA